MTVRLTTLENGLRVATDTMDTVETVTLGAWVETGSRDEPAELNGISHFLEHMVFKGTARRTARAIAEEIEAVGGHINAYTSRENTAFYAKVLKEDVGLAVDLVSDIMMHATMDPIELEREKSVICQEIHQAHDTPDDVVFDLFQEKAFPDQPLGRPVLGTENVVRSLTRDDIQKYLRVGYTAQDTVFCAAGRVDHDELVNMIGDAFGGLSTHQRNGREHAQYLGGDHLLARDLEQLHLVLGFDGIGYKDDDFYAASVFSTLFGGGMSSRLFQEIREDRGLAYSIYSFLSCYEDAGLFGIYAGTSADETAELIPVIAAEAAKVIDHINEDEITRARTQLKASILMARESTSSRVEQLARQVMLFGRHLTVDEIVAKVDAVDNAAVKSVAARLFSGTPTVTAVGPISEMEPFEELAARFN
jgi:predicted Zn-dependent peptidase